MNITLGYARKVLARFADSGYCADDARVVDCINSAISKLVIKAPSDATTARMRLHVTSSGCVTLPREVSHIIKANICGRKTEVNNRWYEFLAGGMGSHEDNRTCVLSFNDLGDGFRTHSDIINPRRILVIGEAHEEDAEIIIRGLDEHGKEVLTHVYENDDPTKIIESYQGERVKIRHDVPLYTNNMFSAITSVVKPETNGYVYLATYEPDQLEKTRQIAMYHPSETRPSYRRYFVSGGYSVKSTTIIALVKLRFLPAVNDSDTLLVQNIPAIEAMMKAENLYNAYDFENGEKFEAMAVRYYTEQVENDRMGTTTIDFASGFAPGDVQGVM